jgi:opacity protein-like surface antigen
LDPTVITSTVTGPGLGTAGLINGIGWVASSGAIVGGQVGVNRLFGPHLLAGIETDWQWSSLYGITNSSTPFGTVGFFGAGGNGFTFSVTDQHQVTNFGTARLRTGIVVGNSLWYVTGGVAWGAQVDTLSFQSAANPTIFPGPLAAGPFLPANATFTQWRAGWTAGLGVETKLGYHWSVRLEYLFTDLLGVGQTMPIGVNPAYLVIPGFAGATASATSNWISMFNSIRAGINYKF